MRELTDIEREVLRKHDLWLKDEADGEQADLSGADLRGADLRGANLRGANLKGADLRRADLFGADLRGADLQKANLQKADLQRADLRGANLQGANLQGADLDFSCWPLWCGSKGVTVDLGLVWQLLAHVAVLECDDPEFVVVREMILPYAAKCHRATELGLVEVSA